MSVRIDSTDKQASWISVFRESEPPECRYVADEREARHRCESVRLEITPPDADEFDQTLIWKRLYDALGVTADSPATAVWNGQLKEFCPAEPEIPGGKETTEIEVYALTTNGG